MRPTNFRFAIPLLALLIGLVSPAVAGQTRTTLVSKSSQGQPAQGQNFGTSISDDGRFVAFYSDTDVLPGNDSYLDVYVHDRRTGKTRLVSKTTSGEPADGHSQHPSMSGNGRFVVFTSQAANLPGDGPLYVHDLETGATRLAFEESGGPIDTSLPIQPISESGRYILFTSNDPALPGTSSSDAYRLDRRTGDVRLVSRNSMGDPANESSGAGGISDGGRFVTFASAATNLPEGTGLVIRAYVRDLETGKTRLVSEAPGGEPLPYRASAPAISGNGRMLAFEAILQQSEDCIEARIYVHDRKAGTTRIGSRNTAGEIVEGCPARPSLSDDGRFLAFDSNADNLPGAQVVGPRGFVRDLRSGTTALVTRTTGGSPVQALDVVQSASGGLVAFQSGDDALPGPDEGVYIYARGPL
jgi:Tol biopolymer transport system component